MISIGVRNTWKSVPSHWVALSAVRFHRALRLAAMSRRQHSQLAARADVHTCACGHRAYSVHRYMHGQWPSAVHAAFNNDCFQRCSPPTVFSRVHLWRHSAVGVFFFF
ncbi:MAG: hypothetical protein BJ554DRAFT_3524 [Olpidium bornovanus]|uniref:Uncharacterized protein n=1 Tax=Olpidium bornovanus TaxID=278681 RepID=A0A8H7ZNE4_9FUNG|nr:MAG: hypothetical protein BJ554DRAFT_3524 [Olpidium bornovanus]